MLGRIVFGLALAIVAPAVADDKAAATSEAIRSAIAKSLPLIERSAGEFTKHRECFSCHHQTLPVLALMLARQKGLAVNGDELKRQVTWTADFLGRNEQRFRQGQGTGGQVDTAGYALWGLQVGGYAPDHITEAVVEYLLARHNDRDHWSVTSQRPPSEASDFTTTFLAVQGLSKFTSDGQRDRVGVRMGKAREWLRATVPQDTEDHVFRLRGLQAVDAEKETLENAATQLLARQRADGGWAQHKEMESDAYATGSALSALFEAHAVTPQDEPFRRGIQFLLGTQQSDGSWRVATRSKPIQQYFETGFPHGVDQFISMNATCWSVISLAVTLADAEPPRGEPNKRYDVVVYGGTAGGVAAAVQARRMGKSALLIEQSKHLGGLTSGGLGATDIGNKAAIGGISREFYQRVKTFYDDPQSWKQQTRDEYRSSRQAAGEDTMWTFEPRIAERILNDMTTLAGVDVVLQERLDLKNGVQKTESQITALRMESGKVFEGKQFIDATYEGDLLARAGVSYTVGREANSQYGETLNGVQTRNAIHHQFVPGVDPYVKQGEPASGLLPGVHGGPPGEEGAADRKVQAYCFRMCVTDAPENRIPFEKPAGYDELRYELLLRNFEAGEKRIPWSPTPMPNRKTDTNNNYGFSTDNIGMNYEWADGDYALRERVFQEHLQYQKGLMWTLANHPRVPEKIRQEVSRWGNCKDEFVENGGWSHQLYVREARRMVGDYVMSQSHCQGQDIVPDPVGLAAYTMDSHNIQRYVDAQGKVRNEGDVQVGGFPPYGISYRSIVPKESECTNLLVPICMSATHIAYGSIRMEPVFMVLGQSAATAACLSLDAQVPVQRIEYEKLRERLVADKQVLVWTGPKRNNASLDPARLKGIVLDDDAMERIGDWQPSSSIGGFVGRCYWHDSHEGLGQKSVRFAIKLQSGGKYDIRFAYTANPNRATNVSVTVHHAEGDTMLRVNERESPPLEKTFVSLGKYQFEAGQAYWVNVSNRDADGHVVVDALQLLPE